MVLEATQTVPLELWEDGTIRVGGSRLLIDLIISAHDRGECPEEIFETYPSKHYTVADIYSVIAYYLANKKKFDRYLNNRKNDADVVWKKIESDPAQRDFRNSLKAKMGKVGKERETEL